MSVKKSFTPRNVLNDFGSKNRHVKTFIKIALKNLDFEGQDHQNWKETVSKIYGEKIFTKPFKFPAFSEKQFDQTLYCHHLFYSLIVKLVLAELLTVYHAKQPSSFLKSLLAASTNEFQDYFNSILDESFFREFKIPNLLEIDFYSTPIQTSNREVRNSVLDVAKLLHSYDFSSALVEPDFFKHFYQSLIPRSIRHLLGEYFTPNWIAEFIFKELGPLSPKTSRILDPGCGSGTFLVQGIKAIKQAGENAGLPERETLKAILENVVGIDLNPISVLTAKANYIIQLLDLPCSIERELRLPIHLNDTIIDSIKVKRVDYLVGNPPWISWDLLPRSYRQKTKQLWENHGLFSLDGRSARYGGSKKDLSILFTYMSAEKFLKNRGILAFLLTLTNFKTKGAGDGFRRFELGTGESLKVLKVHDLSSLNPFKNASSQTTILFLQKGEPTAYPIPYYVWRKDDDRILQARLLATPVDPSQMTSPWLTLDEDSQNLKSIFGRSHYSAREGVNSGGSNGVFWFRILERLNSGDILIKNDPSFGKISVPQVEARIESKNVYPLLKSKNIKKWKVSFNAIYVVITQDPKSKQGIPLERFSQLYPKQFAYLKTFENVLKNRALYKKYFAKSKAPFYSMYNVQEETFSRFKVAWSRMSKNLEASVIIPIKDRYLMETIPLPQETISYVPFEELEEAGFFCAMINSQLSNKFVRSYSVLGGKGFASTHVLEYLRIPKYDKKNDVHRSLSLLAQTLIFDKEKMDVVERDQLEKEITQLSSQVYGIS